MAAPSNDDVLGAMLRMRLSPDAPTFNLQQTADQADGGAVSLFGMFYSTPAQQREYFERNLHELVNEIEGDCSEDDYSEKDSEDDFKEDSDDEDDDLFFDGNLVRWTWFWEQFQIDILESGRLSKAKKLNKLKNHLFGEAFDAVMHLDGDKYNEAAALLEEKYGNPEKIALACAEVVHSMPLLTRTDFRSLRNFADEVVETLYFFQTDEKLKQVYEEKLAIELVGKLPVVVRNRMEKKQKSSWTIDRFTESLQKEVGIALAQIPAEPQENNANTVVLSSPIRNEGNAEVLVQTAVSQVKSKSTTSTANVRLGGTNLTLISKQLADKLQLKPISQEEYAFKTLFQEKVATETVDVVTFSLITKKGPLPVKALVREKLSEPLNIQGRAQLKNSGYLKGIELAHPFTDDELFEVDLWIGNDLKNEIVGTETVKGDGPNAIESSLGYLLCGPMKKQ